MGSRLWAFFTESLQIELLSRSLNTPQTHVNTWAIHHIRLSIVWWRHQMETFSALLVLCEENPPVTGGFPSLRPVTRSFGVLLDLRLKKRMSKLSRPRWFPMPSRPLWRHCNGNVAVQQCCAGSVKISTWVKILARAVTREILRDPVVNGLSGTQATDLLSSSQVLAFCCAWLSVCSFVCCYCCS